MPLLSELFISLGSLAIGMAVLVDLGARAFEERPGKRRSSSRTPRCFALPDGLMVVFSVSGGCRFDRGLKSEMSL